MSKITLNEPWLDTDNPTVSYSHINVKKALSTFESDLQLLLTERTRVMEKVSCKLRKESCKRRIANEAVLENEKKISTLMSACSDLVWEIDADFIITYVGNEVLDLTGYQPGEVINRSVLDFVSALEVEKIKASLKQKLEKKCAFRHFECEVLHKNGQKLILETSGAPYVSAAGKTHGFICISRNITKQKQMEQEVFKASKLESLSVLAGGIAHDFNNMLTAINGNIALAKILSEPEGKVEQILNSAQHACKMATGLTRQLLTFSKGDDPAKKIVYVREIIKETVQFSLRGSNVRCKFDIVDDLFPVEIDEGQICQVINNLTINAGQAMPDGGLLKMTGDNIVVRENDILSIPPGNYIKLTLLDHGVGIDEAALGKIFDPYFTTKEKGSGLGLAVSYSIIKNHGGHISVESKKGWGTIFYIYLPAAQSCPVAQKQQKVKVGPGPKRLKILLMDDEQIVLEISKDILMHMGHEVDTALDGNEAVSKFLKAKGNNAPFSVVIMDLTIPGGQGAQGAISRIKGLDPGIKAVVVSGYSNAPEMVNFADYGFDAAIVKPYDIEMLSTILASIEKEGLGG